MNKLFRSFWFFFIGFMLSSLAVAEDLAVVAQKTNNPISDAWLLITQNDFTVLGGDGIDGTENLNVLKFQPVLSFPMFDESWNYLFRPVVQITSAPLDDDLESTDPFGDRTNGLGDLVLLNLFGPNRNDGWIWGLGPTFIVPTATEDVLGQEKWQAGPALLAVRLGNKSGGWGLDHFNIGALAQQWWSFGGDSDRDAVSQMDIQYFINWRRDPIRLIGMTPNIRINWKESGSDRYSIPVGLGTISLFKWGNTPVRWGVEAQYYVTQPDPVAPEWNFRVFFAPVIGNPMKAPKITSISAEFDRYVSREPNRDVHPYWR
ncbi:MAG: hypothetical protein ACR2QG_05640 [Gammaproteobacteria bacterium]